MADLNLQNLKIFMSICNEGSMAKAAEANNLVVSAVSKRMRQLESELGVQLLKRTKHGVNPSPAGAALLQHAQGLQFAVDNIHSVMRTHKNEEKHHILIHASPSAIAESLFEDIGVFLANPTNDLIHINVEEVMTLDLVNAVRKGKELLGVCWSYANLDQLESQTYRYDHLVVVVNEAHPLASKESILFEETLDFEHVSWMPKGRVAQLLNNSAEAKGKLISHRIVVSNYDAALRVVSAGAGLSIIPEEILKSYKLPGLKGIKLIDSWATRRFVVCYKNYNALPIQTKTLVDFLVTRHHQG